MNFNVNPKVFIAEFIGTFALVFVGAGAAAVGKDPVGTALAEGLVFAAFIYAYGGISGGYFNPAITFALALNKVLQWAEAIYLWIAQFLGGILGATVLFFATSGSKTLGQTVPASNVNLWEAILIETVLTFLLVTVIFHTAVAGMTKDYTGLVIGLALASCVLLGGPLTGGSLNPARTFGPAIFTGTFLQFGIYLVGPLLGAAGAALLFRYMSTK